MKSCPFCKQDVPDAFRVCTHCNRVLERACPFCAEMISTQARVCRFCSSDLGNAPEGGPLPRPVGPVGEDRSLVLWVILTLLTCNLGVLIWIYLIGNDLNAHGRRDRLNTGIDLLLVILTCGLWTYYLMYRYPRTYMDILEEEGGRSSSDLAVLCLIVGIFVPVVSLAILQSEMNGHWRQHQVARHGTSFAV